MSKNNPTELDGLVCRHDLCYPSRIWEHSKQHLVCFRGSIESALLFKEVNMVNITNRIIGLILYNSCYFIIYIHYKNKSTDVALDTYTVLIFILHYLYLYSKFSLYLSLWLCDPNLLALNRKLPVPRFNCDPWPKTSATGCQHKYLASAWTKQKPFQSFNPRSHLTGIYAAYIFASNSIRSVSAEIGPITITTDPKKFQDELRELYVQVSSCTSHEVCWFEHIKSQRRPVSIWVQIHFINSFTFNRCRVHILTAKRRHKVFWLYCNRQRISTLLNSSEVKYFLRSQRTCL